MDEMNETETKRSRKSPSIIVDPFPFFFPSFSFQFGRGGAQPGPNLSQMLAGSMDTLGLTNPSSSFRRPETTLKTGKDRGGNGTSESRRSKRVVDANRENQPRGPSHRFSPFWSITILTQLQSVLAQTQ